jgi:hypothetical protein
MQLEDRVSTRQQRAYRGYLVTRRQRVSTSATDMFWPEKYSQVDRVDERGLLKEASADLRASFATGYAEGIRQG